VLLVIALLLAAGNLWFTAARSTIPLAIDNVVVAKEIRHEKHPPRDDVCLLHLQSGRALHVDAALFDAVAKGATLHKLAWSDVLVHDGRELKLALSIDFVGMTRVMPGLFLILCVTGLALRLAVLEHGDRARTYPRSTPQ